MAGKFIYIHGMRVELFEKSFRVAGMGTVIFVGDALVETKAREIIGVLYEHYEKEFTRELKEALKIKFDIFLEKFVDL